MFELTAAQRRALLWLPENGAWKKLTAEMGASVYSLANNKRLAEIKQLDDGKYARLNQTGSAERWIRVWNEQESAA
jgi:hypothetical protein